MSYIMFCDKCKEEIKDKKNNIIDNRVELIIGKWIFQVIIGRDKTWNSGHLCLSCFKKLVAKL